MSSRPCCSRLRVESDRGRTHTGVWSLHTSTALLSCHTTPTNTDAHAHMHAPILCKEASNCTEAGKDIKVLLHDVVKPRICKLGGPIIVIYKIDSSRHCASDFPAWRQRPKFIAVHTVKVSSKTEHTESFIPLRTKEQDQPQCWQPQTGVS